MGLVHGGFCAKDLLLHWHRNNLTITHSAREATMPDMSKEIARIPRELTIKQ